MIHLRENTFITLILSLSGSFFLSSYIQGIRSANSKVLDSRHRSIERTSISHEQILDTNLYDIEIEQRQSDLCVYMNMYAGSA